uniref:Uncharacterized protein n=1 Tax=Arundo donax TaxID=35708 RepID=A0A0A8YK75_ARUDO
MVTDHNTTLSFSMFFTLSLSATILASFSTIDL